MGLPVERDDSTPRLAWPLLLAVAGLKLAVHLPLLNRYGYFRDELYFLDCGRHLAWGYVDHAPLVGLVAWLVLALGAALPVLRLTAAVAGAGLVFLTGAIAWRLGGRRFAQGFAALAVACVPINLAMSSLLTMNVFEPLFWMGAVYALLRVIETGARRHWLVFGALVGLGLMNKHSTVFFAIAITAGVLLSPLRRHLRHAGPWLAIALACVIVVPNLIWQVQHDFATLEDLQNVARSGKNVVLGPLAFVGQQLLVQHPGLAYIWIAGLGYLFLGRQGRFRLLAWTFIIFFLMLFALKAKNYYLAPIYPMLFAAGAVALESGLARWRVTRARVWPKAVLSALVVANGVVIAPLMLPLLAPEAYVAYEKTLGLAPPKTEVAHRGRLPQMFGDQFGWPELVEEVARIYHALPPAERAKAVIFANNYGEAGAVNLFGPRHGLPRAISGHQTHYLWGWGASTGDVVIVLQDNRERLEELCTSVEQAGEHSHPWGMAEENQPIHVCRGLKSSFAELWPQVKHWN